MKMPIKVSLILLALTTGILHLHAQGTAFMLHRLRLSLLGWLMASSALAQGELKRELGELKQLVGSLAGKLNGGER